MLKKIFVSFSGFIEMLGRQQAYLKISSFFLALPSNKGTQRANRDVYWRGKNQWIFQVSASAHGL